MLNSMLTYVVSAFRRTEGGREMIRRIGVPRFGNAAIATLTLSLIGGAPALAAAAEPDTKTTTFSKDLAPIFQPK
jgi:hypothetical protein